MLPSSEKAVFTNPVIPGFNPDPSICRVGEDYFLVVSTFGYFPGIPVYHSQDLAHWTQISHVIADEGMLDYSGMSVNEGIWAPTIRHHNGVFYVVATLARNLTSEKTFVCTASDPAGPWSSPVELDAKGIDPSLFFDDDGVCWFTMARDCLCGDGGPGEIWMRRLDLANLQLVGQTHILWHGAVRGAWIEAPHQYYHDGRYHLLVAEGGTGRNHSVTAAISENVTGPYRVDPRSPLLTHRHLGKEELIQNVGHVDLVDTPDGDWWAVGLAVRAKDDAHVLGRETFLIPASWSPDGIVFAPGVGRIQEQGEVKLAARSVEEDSAWMSLRGLASYSHGPGGVLLTPSNEDLSGTGTPAFLARRQQHEEFSWTCVLFPEQILPGIQAGLVAFVHEDRWATIGIMNGVLSVISRSNGAEKVLLEAPLDPENTDKPLDSVSLVIRGNGSTYEFSCGTRATQVCRSFFSTEEAGGFVGTTLGLFAIGDSATPVSFADIEYTH